jgi:hypothetical protein
MAYLGGWSNYQAKLDEIAANGYEGVVLSSPLGSPVTAR